MSEGVHLEIATICKSVYQTALGIVRRFFNAAQMRILKEVFRKIKNGVCLVLGGPGCKKTATVGHAVAILNLVGHKILVVAEENLCLDNFMIKLKQARRELLDALGDDESSTVL